jgi:hypothetical protein
MNTKPHSCFDAKDVDVVIKQLHLQCGSQLLVVGDPLNRMIQN